MSIDMEALAADRAFAELTPDERRVVLAELGSEEAYTVMRSVILTARAALAPAADDPLPRPESRAMLRSALRQQSRARTVWSLERVLSFRVPVYQPMLLGAAVVIFFLLWGGGPFNSLLPVRERVVYVPLHDTVVRTAAYEEPIIDEERIVRRVVDSLTRELERRRKAGRQNGTRYRRERREMVEEMPPQSAPDLYQPERNGKPANIYVGLGNLPGLNAQRRGKTFAEDSNAARFATPVEHYKN